MARAAGAMIPATPPREALYRRHVGWRKEGGCVDWASLLGRASIEAKEKKLRRRRHAKLRTDVELLMSFVSDFCDAKHRHAPRRAVALRGCELQWMCDHGPVLCADCARLLQHAVVKRSVCPHDPKPTCRRCGTQCYAPRYRRLIRQVMAFAGRRAVLRGRLDYLLHLLP